MYTVNLIKNKKKPQAQSALISSVDGNRQRYCCGQNSAESNRDYLHKHHIHFPHNPPKKPHP